jgi:hypothetical protein
MLRILLSHASIYQMAMKSLQLAEGVYSCLAGDRMVFLDLRRNQYSCLNQKHTRLALGLLSPVDTRGVEPEELRSVDLSERAKVARALIVGGLIALGGASRRTPTVCVETPKKALQTVKDADRTVPRVGQCITFFEACVAASWKLRRFSMQRAATSVTNRKQNGGKDKHLDSDALSDLTRAFHYLRPLHSREYVCLFDSLALIEFLARYQLFPDWVFGVRGEPFCAHCWVQDRDCILNDSVEYIRSFTPIMAI